ncbi:MAG: hypothetical protein ACYC5O_13090 [Anaerolineae bacterium]
MYGRQTRKDTVLTFVTNLAVAAMLGACLALTATLLLVLPML